MGRNIIAEKFSNRNGETTRAKMNIGQNKSKGICIINQKLPNKMLTPLLMERSFEFKN